MPLLFVATPLIELFYRANVRVLLWLNGYFAAHSSLYKVALFLGDRGADLLVLSALLLLWFWPRNENSRSIFGDAPLSTKRATKLDRRAWLRDFLATVTYENENGPLVTRQQSRAQVLIFVLGGLAAFVLVRLLAAEINIARPFASYWPVSAPSDMPYVFDGLRRLASFPGDHAAMLAALAAALFFWNRQLGWLMTGAALVMCLCRVAVGFHYPLDVMAGAFIGFACVWLPLNAYRKGGSWFRGANELARAFDLSNTPYCYILYFLVLLIGVEAMMHFEHLLNIIFAVRGALMHSLGR